MVPDQIKKEESLWEAGWSGREKAQLLCMSLTTYAMGLGAVQTGIYPEVNHMHGLPKLFALADGIFLMSWWSSDVRTGNRRSPTDLKNKAFIIIGFRSDRTKIAFPMD